MNITALKTKAQPITDKARTLTLRAQDAVNPYELSTVAIITGLGLLFVGMLTWSGISFLGLLILLIGGGFSTKEAYERKAAEAENKKSEPAGTKEAVSGDD